MSKLDTQDLIQLLGIVGIIGSLIFVGLEKRQSQRIAMAGQQMERTALSANRFAAYNEAGLDWHSVSLANRPDLADKYPEYSSSVSTIRAEEKCLPSNDIDTEFT